jgi:hypothetical protein
LVSIKRGKTLYISKPIHNHKLVNTMEKEHSMQKQVIKVYTTGVTGEEDE